MNYPAYLKKLAAGEPVANPFLTFMDMTLEELRDGYARFSMPVRPEYLQGAGVMQGGISVALSSETVAHAVMTTLGPDEGITTIELKNNFLSQVSGGRLTAEATLFKRGRRIIIADCIVSDDAGKIISRSTSSLMVLKKN